MDLSNFSLENLNLSMIMDVVVALILLFSVGIAFFRGFVREVLTIAGLIGGIGCAFLFGASLEEPVAQMIGVNLSDASAKKIINPIPNDFIVKGIAYGGIMLSVVIVLSIASFFISKKLKDTGLGPVDRTLGVFFGLARAVLVIGFLYLPLFLMLETKKREELFPSAVSRVYVEWSAAGVEGLLPKDVVPEKLKAKNDTELAKFTREKLQEIDVLKNTAPQALKTEAGYSPVNRDKLDSLIEREGGQYNE